MMVKDKEGLGSNPSASPLLCVHQDELFDLSVTQLS